MESIKEKALKFFDADMNCSQSVFSAYAEKLNLSREITEAVACGFGGGMGRLLDTCGAVTGAFMVISFYSYSKFEKMQDRKEYSYKLIQEFDRKFKEKNKTTKCFELLGCDLNTVEGRALAKERNKYDNICNRCIVDSINILEELMK